MKKILPFIIFCLLLLQDATAQLLQPSIIWQHTLANRGYRDIFADVIETQDKSLIAVGKYGVADYDCANLPYINYDTAPGWPTLHIINGKRMVAVKYDSSGNLVWKMALGNEHCEAFKIIPDPNGGYIIYGHYNWDIYSTAQDTSATSIGSQGKSGLWLTKIDDNGHVFWQKIFGFGGGMKATSDGGFLISTGKNLSSVIGDFYGLTSNDAHGLSDAVLLKFDANFNLIWSKNYGGSNDDQLGNSVEDADGNFIFTGSTSSTDGDLEGIGGISGDVDTWLAKINGSNGNIIWQKKIGSPNCTDYGYRILHTNDNALLVNIYISSGTFYYNSQALHGQCIMKLTEQGMFQWVKDYSDIGLYGSGNGMINLGDGVPFFNYTNLENDPSGGYIYTTNNDLHPLHPDEYYGTIYDDGQLRGTYDYTIAKADLNGNIVAHKMLGGTNIEWGTPSLFFTSDNNMLLWGCSGSEDRDLTGNTTHPRTNPYDPDQDGWIVKLSPFSVAPPPQPVLNLNASPAQTDVQVSWQIPNETNMLQYYIERSFNNASFFRIGRKLAAGNHAVMQAYQFADSGALALNFPHFYYRIACIDSLGRISYSNTVSVNHPLQVSLTGTRQSNDVVLSWTGRFEFALDHYTLQTSFNGTDFTNLTTQQATGANAQPFTYSYSHNNAATIDTPYLYYRLQFTDTTGAISFSAVLAMHHPMMSQLSGDWAASQINLLSQTKYEQNIQQHYLQSSFNGNNFSNIDSTATLGTADFLQQYNFTHPTVDTADLYFRILHHDSTGNSTYSNVIALHHPLVLEATGQWQNNGVSLSCNTRYETAMDRLVVQRSIDGIHFSDIASIAATGNSNSWETYTFADPALDTAYLYYRILAADSSGRTWISDTIMLHHPMQLNFDGQLANNNIQLTWNTKYERNIQSYQLQRSYNGLDYADIDNQPTAGNSDQWQQYTFSDVNARLIDTPYLHYRLAYTDSNGNTLYSSVYRYQHPMVVQFTATWQQQDVDIRWSSKYQQNILHYQVQRSFDASNFSSIHTTNANGNNNGMLYYNHTDANIIPLNEAYQYYRLMVTDSAGGVQYTDTIALHHPLTTNIQATWSQLNALITWNTQFEENVQQLVVQRSKDATNYIDITSLNTQGNSDAVQHYQHIDDQLYLDYANDYYYRIKIVYANGQTVYTDTAELHRSSNIVVLAPNPTTGRITIQSNACKGYWVTDAMGQTVMRVVGGRQNLIDIARLSNGLYWITLLMDDNTTKTIRIMKQD